MTLAIMKQLKHCAWNFIGKTIWWYCTLLVMYNRCSTSFFIVSLSNWSKYFLTTFDFILAIANVFGFLPALTSWYTSSISFWCSSAIFFHVTHSKVETAFKLLTVSSSFLPSSSKMAQLIFCASCLRSSGILHYWGTDLQPHRPMNRK